MWKVGPERQFVDRFTGTGRTGGTGRQIPAGLFLCAGTVLESHRLAMGVPADIFSRMWPRKVPRHTQSNSKPLPRCPNAGPGVPKCAPRLPKVPQRDAKGSPKRNKRSAMRSRKHAWAFQNEFKGSIYIKTPDQPQQRPLFIIYHNISADSLISKRKLGPDLVTISNPKI